MRICMLLNNFEPPFGGPELQAIAIASRLIEREHQIILVAKGTGIAPQSEQLNGIPVYRLNRKGCGSIEAWLKLLKLKDQFDIIHVHGVGRLASIAICFARKHGKKVYIKVTTAGHMVKEVKPGLMGMLKNLSPFRDRKVALLKQADGIIGMSDEILAEMERHNFLTEKIFYIPNGVDTDRFCPVIDHHEKVALRKKLCLPLAKTVFIFTGKITRRKGIDILLRAWQRASDIQDKAVLLLVGSGAGQSDNLEEWARRFVKEHGLSNTVIFAGEQKNVNEYLSAANCLVFPSRREGLSNSLLEAMASGLICIVSDIGGNTDLVKTGVTGVLVPNEEIDCWCQTIQNAARYPSDILGLRATKLIVDNYSINVTVSRIERMYQQGTGLHDV